MIEEWCAEAGGVAEDHRRCWNSVKGEIGDGGERGREVLILGLLRWFKWRREENDDDMALPWR